MDFADYNTGLFAGLLTNMADDAPGNHSSVSHFDGLFGGMDGAASSNGNHSQNPQHLVTFLQHFFSKMSDNQSALHIPSSMSAARSSTGVLSPASSLPASSNDANTSHVLAILSLWFVLIVNPIVIFFGVVGNLLATYILIKGNIAKLPVSFYTIMLNISDTLNLLLPVFIFWLDNCFNRTPESGYFRDKSNFLCKALMCPDQLFAALSAWYMCAISFNRWCSVCRPSTYFFRTTTSAVKSTSSATGIVKNIHREKKLGVSPSLLSTLAHRMSLDCCCCLKHSRKYRQHLQAFRYIAVITFIGILTCLYPVFMHELRPVMSTNKHVFDLNQKTSRTISIVWSRCYYSRKHEYVYDIIGIILSSFLHILPLTSVAVMNIMIIVRLRKRQRIMLNASHSTRVVSVHHKQPDSARDLRESTSCRFNNSTTKEIRPARMTKSLSQRSLTTHKDQETSTDASIQTGRKRHNKTVVTAGSAAPSRHQARDRNITIMLVSVALSYLILTLPYRLFWSYNVYIKRMHPDKLSSSVYLLKMHHIDHVLRTIRNIHYGTNFIFFIFLSKPFRRKFRQLFRPKQLYSAAHRAEQNSNTYTCNAVKGFDPQEYPWKADDVRANQLRHNIIEDDGAVEKECSRRNSRDSDDSIRSKQLHSIVHLGQSAPVNGFV